MFGIIINLRVRVTTFLFFSDLERLCWVSVSSIFYEWCLVVADVICEVIEFSLGVWNLTKWRLVCWCFGNGLGCENWLWCYRVWMTSFRFGWLEWPIRCVVVSDWFFVIVVLGFEILRHYGSTVVDFCAGFFLFFLCAICRFAGEIPCPWNCVCRLRFITLVFSRKGKNLGRKKRVDPKIVARKVAWKERIFGPWYFNFRLNELWHYYFLDMLDITK